jgi:hypothetical protein
VRLCVVWLVLLVSIIAGSGLEAQDFRAQVPPTGSLGLRVGGSFSAYDTRFGHPFRAGETTRQPLTDEAFVGAISDVNFAPFGALRTNLNTFFQGTLQSPLVTAGALALQTEHLLVAADHRAVPFELELGVLPRIGVAVRVPLVQHWLEVTGFQIAGGNVGWNPDRPGNQALLAEVDTAFAALGAGIFLPTRGSLLGNALQEQVRAATGGRELQLPGGPLTQVGVGGVTGADRIWTGRYDPGRPAWEIGDAELRLSFQLLQPRTPGDANGQGGIDVRAVIDVGARLPTGAAPDTGYLAFPRPEQGLGGFSLGLRTDVEGRRVGAFAAARLQNLRPVTLQQRLWLAGAQGVGTGLPAAPTSVVGVRWEPGTQLSIDVRPYVRVAEEIRIAAAYGFQRRTGQAYTLTLPPAAGGAAEQTFSADESAQRWGLGMEYSTVRAYQQGRANVPFEALLLFRNTFAGSGGAPAERSVEMQARVFVRLWGGR